MFTAVGTSGVLVSSGLLAWQVYQTQMGQQQIVELKEKLNTQQSQQKMLLEELNKTQFVTISKELTNKLNYNKELSNMNSFETKEDLKSILPRHLRKPCACSTSPTLDVTSSTSRLSWTLASLVLVMESTSSWLRAVSAEQL